MSALRSGYAGPLALASSPRSSPRMRITCGGAASPASPLGSPAGSGGGSVASPLPAPFFGRGGARQLRYDSLRVDIPQPRMSVVAHSSTSPPAGTAHAHGGGGGAAAMAPEAAAATKPAASPVPGTAPADKAAGQQHAPPRVAPPAPVGAPAGGAPAAAAPATPSAPFAPLAWSRAPQSRLEHTVSQIDFLIAAGRVSPARAMPENQLLLDCVTLSSEGMLTLNVLLESPGAAAPAGARLEWLCNLLGCASEVAGLAAEVLCRVCENPADVRAHETALAPLVQPLLAALRARVGSAADWPIPASPFASISSPEPAATANPAGSIQQRDLSILFFSVGSLVRLMGSPALAASVLDNGGVPVLIAALAAAPVRAPEGPRPTTGVAPASVCQVATYALYRLQQTVDGDLTDTQLSAIEPPSGAAGAAAAAAGAPQARVLVEIARCGGFGRLATVLVAGEGSARELAYRQLLDMALVREVQQTVADRGEVGPLVAALKAAAEAAKQEAAEGGAAAAAAAAAPGAGGKPAGVRPLELLVLLARLCARCTACQLDAVREGAAAPLVSLLSPPPAAPDAAAAQPAAAGEASSAAAGASDARAHAGRLLAILAQHASTHQLLIEAGVLPLALGVLRECEHWYNHQSSRAAAAAAAAAANNAVSALATDLAAFQSALEGLQGTSGSDEDEGTKQQDGTTAAEAASAASASAARAWPSRRRWRIPGNEATGGPAKTPAFGLAPRKQPLEQEAAQQQPPPSARADPSASLVETCASICCMFAHNPDNHFALVNNGAVVLLVPLLARGIPPKTQTYALAALLMLAMWEPRHAAVVARAGCVPPLVTVVRDGVHAGNREFAAALLASLSRSRDIQVEVVAAGGIPALIRLLDEGSPDARAQAAEALLQLATHEPVRCRLMARGGAVGALATVLSDPRRTPAGALWAARLLRVLSEEPTTAQELASCPELLAACAAVLSAPPAYSRSGMTEQDRNAAASSSPAVPEPVTKAQAHVAWTLGRLAVATRGDAREAVRALGVSAGVVPALVAMLRESQRQQGVGLNLATVLQGVQHNSQAAAAYALQALCAGHGANLRAALDELALQVWMGHSIEVDLSPAGLDTELADLQAHRPPSDDEDPFGGCGGFGGPGGGPDGGGGGPDGDIGDAFYRWMRKHRC